MNLIDKDFNVQHFLTQHWQQKPAVLRNLIHHFRDPLDEHELAGLAMQPDVDSRIVSRTATGQWKNTSGPFDGFESVCIDQWSLLVQSVDRHIGEVDDLIEQFTFIPYWRMDDVMVSFSVAGAGVGAHIDQYDVFLIQGKGQRRWQIGEPGDYQEVNRDGLRQINEFTPIIDVITQPGDIIYIPPGWPHRGETIHDALTYSIGFRAPDNEQLIAALHDNLFEQQGKNSRFTDPHREATMHPACVDNGDIERLKQLMIEAVNRPETEEMLMRFLSEQSLDIEPLAPSPESRSDLEMHLPHRITVCRNEAVRPLYRAKQSGATFVFYIDGVGFECSAGLKHIVEPLLNQPLTETKLAVTDPYFAEYCSLLRSLAEQGFYFVD
ncbi:cupin domain-containing protein [Alteromonas oceanisediminis]|uniref:cupin domain-containing protein n=1 Tax=Alteromonas oceanisediminis TaxID=2836180 RepID=UPI001BDB3CEA|nr:cupin domain-containing protein [Alteromonas oceanisediminis]MBT0586585.1 cupin domain-containing protein [Alteromonas oceanisediminis]